MTVASLRQRVTGRVSTLVHHLLREHTGSFRLALAVFFGAIVGASPFYGLHFPIAIGLAYLLRLNKLAIYGAAQVSMPPLAIPLAFASVQLGIRITQGYWAAFGLSEFRQLAPMDAVRTFFAAWLVGGLVLGAAIGLVAGTVTYVFLRRKRAPRDVFARAAARYARMPKKYSIYARMKYAMDPCYREVLALIAPNTFTVDAGCGLGMLSAVLAEAGEGRTSHGIEWDGEKATIAKQALAGVKGVTIEEGDVLSAPLPSCDNLVIVDVLHYFDARTQDQMLDRAIAALRPGGWLIVRETDAAARSGLTRFIESLAVKSGWNRATRLHFRSRESWLLAFKERGLQGVRSNDVSGQVHKGNVLLWGQRQ